MMVANERSKERHVKTSLGIWAFGAMATRFNPGGYKPELAGASTVSKLRTAVEGLDDLIDDYEFHYPQELSHDNLDEVRQALDGHGIYVVATGTHLNPRYGKGGTSSPNDDVRNAALAEALETAALAGEIGSQMVLWPGAEGLLGHLHANSGWGTFDDDNMVGATAFMETLELAIELRRARYGENGERLGFDLYPYTEDAVGAVKRSVLQWRFIDEVAGRIDEAELRRAQQAKDAVRAYELVYAALGE